MDSEWAKIKINNQIGKTVRSIQIIIAMIIEAIQKINKIRIKGKKAAQVMEQAKEGIMERFH